MVHVSSLSLGSKMTIHPAREAQIASLVAKEVIIPAKYLDFAHVFSKESAKVSLKCTRINEHAIELENGKQSPYGTIYSLDPVELEILKIYIKTNLANVFIRPLKSPADASIVFVCKPNNSFWLCVNCRDLNNLSIKNRYPLSLISESLDWLKRAKRFTQLNLTNAYHWMRIKEGDK